MADLYPTKTRLRLLAEIANYQVLTDITRDDDQDVILLFPDAPTSWQNSVKVTGRVRQLEREGWVEEFVLPMLGPTWSLTEAGWKVLNENEVVHG